MIRQTCETPIRREVHLVEYILPFFILISQYSFGILNLGTLLLLIIGIILTAKKSGKLQFPAYYKPFMAFLVYILIRDLFRMVLGPDAFQIQINRMIEYLIIYFLVFLVCTQDFSEDILYKVWKIAGVIFTAGLVVQVVQIYILGHRIAPISIIPGYTLRTVDSIAQTRPSSFFSEPAAFVNAIIPLEFLSLRRKNFKWAVFVTVAILLSGSTVGVILSIVLWTLELLSRDNSLWKRIIILVIALVIIAIFTNLDVFDISFTKFLQVIGGESTFGSRVQIGMEVIRRQSLFEIICGTNYNDVATFVTNRNASFSNSIIVMSYWRSGRLFLNTFSRLIFQYGIIGLMLFLNPLVLYLKQQKYKAKMLIIMFFVAIFGQSVLLNTYYYVWIILFLLYEKDSLVE